MKIEADELRDFAERYTAAWCSQEPERLAGFFSPNGSLSVNGALSVGRSAIAEVARGFMTAFPDMNVAMDDVIVDGERAVYHWTLTGTNTGPGGSGRRVRVSGFEVWTIGADRLIEESRGQFDEAEYSRQLRST